MEIHYTDPIAAPPAAWRSILEALAVAAGDSSPQVVSGAMEALQQVIELLFQVRGTHQLSMTCHLCRCQSAISHAATLETL